MVELAHHLLVGGRHRHEPFVEHLEFLSVSGFYQSNPLFVALFLANEVLLGLEAD